MWPLRTRSTTDVSAPLRSSGICWASQLCGGSCLNETGIGANRPTGKIEERCPSSESSPKSHDLELRGCPKFSWNLK